MSESIIIGVTGGSGSGKSSLVRELGKASSSKDICVITQDDYYLPYESQTTDSKGVVNFDLPSAFDMDALVSDLRDLRNGRAVDRPEYTFNQKSKKPSVKTLSPAPLIILEGLFLSCEKRLSDLMDYCVFVQMDAQQQLIRRIARDTNERGYSMHDVRYQWKHHVLPAYEEFVLPYRETCSLVIDNGGTVEDMVDQMVDFLAIRVGMTMAGNQLW